jgi:hypothetical protein
MQLHSCHIRNLRRLRDAHVDLAGTTTTFVGANNSGKTTAAQAFVLFLNSPARGRFSVHDFNNGVWDAFDQAAAAEPGAATFPAISLDLWFEVDDQSLHRVYELLPDLDWGGSKVGIRISYEARDPLLLHANYHKMAADAAESLAQSEPGDANEAGAAAASAEPDTNRGRRTCSITWNGDSTTSTSFGTTSWMSRSSTRQARRSHRSISLRGWTAHGS